MKVFIIHRSFAEQDARIFLRSLRRTHGIVVTPIILNSFDGSGWQDEALSSFNACEAILVFNSKDCRGSKNATWEIEEARRSGKPLVFVDSKNVDENELAKLRAVYDNSEEFDSMFGDELDHCETLYKVMIDSSESLIQRRQRMNAFFITAIGSLLAIAGALLQFAEFNSPAIQFLAMAGFGMAALFLCNSWRNLVDNYGKLNAAKFRVIHRLEQQFASKIFQAEWVALGKGLRPDKYQSFTSTENKVPLWFAWLVFFLIMSGCWVHLFS